MELDSTAHIIETDYFYVEVEKSDAGFKRFWLKNQAGSGLYPTENNGVANNGGKLLVLASSSDSMGLSIKEKEFYTSDFEWITYGLELEARDLYGKQWTADPETQISCLKSVSDTKHSLGGGRTLVRWEILYFPTIDKKGLYKKYSFRVSKDNENSDNINSAILTCGVGLSNAFRERDNTCQAGLFGFQAGFDYDSVAKLNADWSFDSGISYGMARKSNFPNLLPNFTGWQTATGTPVTNSGRSISLKAGDKIRVWAKQAIPANAWGTFCFNFVSGDGEVKIRTAYNRDMNDIGYDDETSITATGATQIAAKASTLDHVIFVEMECMSGTWTVNDPMFQMLYKPGNSYVEPDGSVLSINGWWNSLKISGTNLSGKSFKRIFESPMDVDKSIAVGVWIMPQTDGIPSPGFRFKFILSDDSVVYSNEMDIWTDWNETWGNNPGRFSYWAECFYFEFIPEGVTQIKGIGIEILTDENISWVIDDLFFFTWQSRQRGPGVYAKHNVGLKAYQSRQDTRVLSNYVVGELPNDSTLIRDKVNITKIDQASGGYYISRCPLSATNIVGSQPNAVFRYKEVTVVTSGSGWTRTGGRASYTLPTDCEFLKEVINRTKSEAYTILSHDTGIVCIDVGTARLQNTDVLEAVYYKKDILSPVNYYGIEWRSDNNCYVIHFVDNQTMIDLAGAVLYVEYEIEARHDPKIDMLVIGSRSTSNIIMDNRNPDTASPAVACQNKIFFSMEGNTLGETMVCIYPMVNETNRKAVAVAMNDKTLSLVSNTRVEPLNPTPRNWNIVPHISFAGEFVASDPMYYMDSIHDRFARGNIGNCIVSGGSLAASKSRLHDYWFGWSNAVLDSGVSFVDGMRDVIRRGYQEESISKNLNWHRYFVEVTLFNYDFLNKHRGQIGIGPDGKQKYKRVWYYETEDGSDYYVIQHGIDDMDQSYYKPINRNAKIFYFKYHYSMNYPAYWATVTSGDDWPENITTVYDMWKKMAEAYCKNYDCEGVILSEFIMSYKYGCSDKDLELYNSWRTANGHESLLDWVRDGAGDVQCDDALLWEWKCRQTEEATKDAAAMVHGHGKLLGMSAEVEPIISVCDIDAEVWDGYTKTARTYQMGSEPEQTHWHVRELTHNCKRYGQDYDGLLTADKVDFFYVWLYYRYCPEEWYITDGKFTYDIIDDFINHYQQYKERLIVCIGAYPRSDPPESSEEIKGALEKLIDAGFNVAYAGFPRIVTWEQYDAMWDWFDDRVPRALYDSDQDVINLEPKKYGGMPFYVRH
ncbi:MAG: hypothetical protein GY710_17270 [Desulfobacteraceae bacterium]|nr:hypothetical protein [Desulfobacteraceae bacterium]